MKSKNINIQTLYIIPVVSYSNAGVLKKKILKDNKNKSGIYCWNNLITGKSYVGSSVSLSKRLYNYYSSNYLRNELKVTKSIIYRSILKNGYSNFSLYIIEYCEKDLLIKREQYYIDVLKPEYNILKIASSPLEQKVSSKTRESISNTLSNNLTILLPIRVINLETKEVNSFSNNLKASIFLDTSESTLIRYINKKVLKEKYWITNNINNHRNSK